uniref:Saposin B-type domain-containing protein n=1 Tax=Strongyloides stercoralis TaxID=6248 RepID=A0A0K0EP39_STRER
MKFIVSIILLACLIGLSTSLFLETKGLMCSTCKFLWKEVKKELPVVAGEGDVELERVVKNVCGKFEKSVPLLGKFCQTFGHDALQDIYQYILSEDKKINPDKICVYTKQC